MAAMGAPAADSSGLMAHPRVNVRQSIQGWCLQCCCVYTPESRFYVEDKPGGHFLVAQEESNCCVRTCCTHCRSLDIKVSRSNDEANPLYTFHRSISCCCHHTLCCNPHMTVLTKDGKNIGHVSIPCYCCNPELIIKEEERQLYRIHSPICNCCSCGNFDFTIHDNENHNTGKQIRHMWPGLIKYMATDSDNYIVDFPDNATEHQRALLVAAAILIDYSFYESGDKEKA